VVLKTPGGEIQALRRRTFGGSETVNEPSLNLWSLRGDSPVLSKQPSFCIGAVTSPWTTAKPQEVPQEDSKRRQNVTWLLKVT
jgi:hypothetical protein